MQINFKEAEFYLGILAGKEDISREKFNFITFYDKKGAIKYPHQYYGTFDQEMREKLAQDNRVGFGIFVAVNRFKDETRQKGNVHSVRCIWQEDDEGFGDFLFPVDPSITVETSPGKYHRIFVFSPESQDFVSWAKMQKTMVSQYGSDKDAKDITRVLRIPGFWHQKGLGKPFQSRVVGGTLGGENKVYSWDELIKHFGKTHRNGDGPGSEVSLGEDLEDLEDIDFLLGEDDQRRITEIFKVYCALQFIDPDKSYGDWLNVGMALHHESRGSSDGFELWETWSSSGTDGKYIPGECQKKWQSFSVETGMSAEGGSRTAGRITIGTLYSMSYKSGWNGHYSAAHPQSNRYLREQQVNVAQRFWNRYRLIDINGKARYVSREHNKELDRIESRFYKSQDLKELYKLDVPYLYRSPTARADAPFSIRLQHVIDFIGNNLDKFQPYKGITFSPKSGLIQSTALPEGEYYNSYVGLRVSPEKGNCNSIKDHLYYYMCDENKVVYDYLMNYLAFVFQCPEKRAEVALVIIGEQGTGKSIIFDSLCHTMFGVAGFVTASAKDFVGDFNSISCERVLVVSDEAYTKFDKRNNSFFKRFITGITVTKNEKFLPAYDVRNCAKLIMISNMEVPVTVEIGDRRFFFIRTNAKRKNDYAYFSGLSRDIKQGGLSAFVYELLERDISKYHPRDANTLIDTAISKSKADSVIEAFDLLDHFVHYHLEKESPFLCGDFGDGTGENEELENWRSSSGTFYRSNDAIFHALKVFYEENRTLYSRQTFPTREKILIRLRKQIKTERTRNEKERGQILHSLQECRKTFEAYAGVCIPWDDDSCILD